jgi:cellulose synthase/poly-beta-1,6-N-acetylglucosamine synthase-like glycosyltransferase
MYLFPPDLTNLQQIVLLIVGMVTGLIAIYAVNLWILTLISVKGRNRTANPPRVASWPKVTVHLPFFNEVSVARRVLEATVNLDYPRDKLEIIVVDDSTDGTTEIAREFEGKYPGLVRVYHRTKPDGFKAGALQEALRNSSGEFLALFDADCVPPRRFLKEMVPYFFLDERIALAQARRGYLDDQSSWIAKATSLAMDIYAFIDQRARYFENLLAHFSGSCGVFRKRALEEVGGWCSDTSAEDLDLSLRLYLGGWRYVYVPKVVCQGEIPSSFDVLRHQNFRYARGFSECLKKHGGAILRSKHLSLFQKSEALLHLGMYFISPLTIAAIVVGILYYSIFPPSFWLTGFWRYQVALLTFVLSLVICSAPVIASGVTVGELSQRGMAKLRRMLHLGYLGALAYGLLLSNTKAVVEGLFSTTIYFYRTPKQGVITVAQKH